MEGACQTPCLSSTVVRDEMLNISEFVLLNIVLFVDLIIDNSA